MKKNKKRNIIVGGVAVLVIAGVVIGAMNMHGKKKQAAATVKQSTFSLSKMTLVQSISATGTLEGDDTKSVSAAVKDIVVGEILVSVGDTVKKGDTLVKFDQKDLEDALTEARENLSDIQEDATREIASAQKQLNSAISTRDEENTKQAVKVAAANKEKTSAKAAVASARKTVASAKKALANAEKKTANASKKVASATNAEKKEKLQAALTQAQEEQSKAQEALTKAQEELTKAQETWKQAKNSYETAVDNQSSTNRQNESSVENARTSVENAQSNREKNIKEAQKQVDTAQQNLEECDVTAPIGGMVTAIYVEEGDSYSGETLLQIDDVSSFTVTTSVDEYDISDVEIGQKAVILTEATDEDELEGEITFVAPSTSSSSSSQSGDGMSSSSEGYEVKIAVKTEDDRLKLGMTAKCSIILEEAEDVFAVPYDAIHEKSDGTYVIYVAEDGDQSSQTEGESAEDDRLQEEGENGRPQMGGEPQGSSRPPMEGEPEGSSRPQREWEAGESSRSQMEGDRTGNGRPQQEEGTEENDSQQNDSQQQDSQQSDSQQNDSGETGYREVTVTKGMESDYYTEISGDGLIEGMKVIIPTDETSASSSGEKSQESGFSMFGGALDNGQNGVPGGGKGSGGQNGGMPGGRQ